MEQVAFDENATCFFTAFYDWAIIIGRFLAFLGRLCDIREVAVFIGARYFFLAVVEYFCTIVASDAYARVGFHFMDDSIDG